MPVLIPHPVNNNNNNDDEENPLSERMFTLATLRLRQEQPLRFSGASLQLLRKVRILEMNLGE